MEFGIVCVFGAECCTWVGLGRGVGGCEYSGCFEV